MVNQRKVHHDKIKQNQFKGLFYKLKIIKKQYKIILDDNIKNKQHIKLNDLNKDNLKEIYSNI